MDNHCISSPSARSEKALIRRFAVRDTSRRGAALILEIIIYLVIVALIAVAVTSGVRAVRDLVFTSHAKGDIQNLQTWMEGKYTQDNVYPGNNTTQGTWLFSDAPRLTSVGGVENSGLLRSVNGANSGYCILVISNSISAPLKSYFWLSSANPAQIMQGGTATANGAVAGISSPPSGIPGLGCP